jgi:hypothetical protein
MRRRWAHSWAEQRTPPQGHRTESVRICSRAGLHAKPLAVEPQLFELKDHFGALLGVLVNQLKGPCGI